MVEVKEGQAIDDGAWQTNSKYLLTIHDELFEHYNTHNVYISTVDMGTHKRPAICIDTKDRIVEVLCDQQKTHITMGIKVGKGFVQPMKTTTFHGWIHLLESELLYDEINLCLDYAVFTKAHAQARIDRTEVLSPSRGRANTIPFYPRNKIEREDYLQLSQ